MDTQGYDEEFFGILTDDQLYLDCTFYRPPGSSDEDLRGIRVWVPKFPLTKTSVMTCARQEVVAAGANGRIAHLIFDLRGSGNSDFKDDNYTNDLAAIKLWAEERFGEISLGFLGTPVVRHGTVDMTPVRPGVVFEQYVHLAKGLPSPRTIIYLATYGNFNEYDDKLCLILSQAGYHVHGIDPLRYLLHASATGRLTPDVLVEDFSNLSSTLMGPPIIIAQPISAGLGLLWGSQSESVRGVIAIGRAQAGFMPRHIFQNENPRAFAISRFMSQIAPRPLALVVDGRSRREDVEETKMLHQMSGQPCRLEMTRVITSKFIKDLVDWIEESP